MSKDKPMYEVSKDKYSEEMDYAELNNYMFGKASGNFMSMVRNLKVTEEMFHYETQLKIKRVK
jgi:hypothetical protein